MDSKAQEVAIRNERIILARMMKRGQNTVAGDIGVSEPTMSRLAGSIQNFSKVLSSLGIQCVDVGRVCFDPEYIRALRRLAKEELEKDETPTLEWPEED